MPTMVHWTEPAGVVPHFGREEAEARRQHYIGPEHLLLGLLRQGDNPAAGLLRAHGLDLATVRAGIDRLVADGALPGPQLSDRELLAPSGSTWTRSGSGSRRTSAGGPGRTPPSGWDWGRSSPFLMRRAAARR